MNVYLIHKIVLYVKDVSITRLLLHRKDYRDYVYNNNGIYDDLILNYTNKNYHRNIDIMRSIHRQITKIDNFISLLNMILQDIVANNDKNIVKWLYEETIYPKIGIKRYIINKNADELLLWMFQQKILELNFDDIYFCIKKDNTYMMKFILIELEKRASGSKFNKHEFSLIVDFAINNCKYGSYIIISLLCLSNYKTYKIPDYLINPNTLRRKIGLYVVQWLCKYKRISDTKIKELKIIHPYEIK